MTVHLVGAGPGDPELLTLRAARLIAAADVIVHDHLADASILTMARPDAELIDVGKRPGRPTPQEIINTLLVHLDSQGLEVVRLKGGDPFVFGRGGEEAEALMAADVEFTVVPGITSAVSVPAAAGIPVTHRGVSAAFTVVTGHREKGGSRAVNWEALAQVGATIVILMGVSERGAIAKRLIAGGLDPSTPVAAVRWGTRPDQHTVRTTLGALGVTPLESPSTIVIGAVAAFEFGARTERTRDAIADTRAASTRAASTVDAGTIHDGVR
ncbi:MAG: uroporphyrinogen-III C-methyltransferase [Acidobacteria bacterium]|nr:uroporphyrinogen-III C-methyltransferase [Acidobacteriota bacterium]